MLKNKTCLIIGQLTLVLGILGEKINPIYLNNSSAIDFLSGLFFGLSLVMNITFLVRYRKVQMH